MPSLNIPPALRLHSSHTVFNGALVFICDYCKSNPSVYPKIIIRTHKKIGAQYLDKVKVAKSRALIGQDPLRQRRGSAAVVPNFLPQKFASSLSSSKLSKFISNKSLLKPWLKHLKMEAFISCCCCYRTETTLDESDKCGIVALKTQR